MEKCQIENNISTLSFHNIPLLCRVLYWGILIANLSIHIDAIFLRMIGHKRDVLVDDDISNSSGKIARTSGITHVSEILQTSVQIARNLEPFSWVSLNNCKCICLSSSITSSHTQKGTISTSSCRERQKPPKIDLPKIGQDISNEVG